MSWYDSILNNLPEVSRPAQRQLPFAEKLKWTAITLVIFFILGLVPLYGLSQNELERFEFLSIILGASFGSIISLGIGPLVTGSIVLQLLNGSGLVKFDLSTQEGKARYQGVQKVMGIFFVIFEAAIYVLMGGLAPNPALLGTSLYAYLQAILIFQLCLGGILIMFMDEVVSKWGFGSGISLFIAAGVAQEVFIRAFSPLHSAQNPDAYIGAIPELFRSLSIGDATTAGILIGSLVSTVLVFLIAVYAESMKVEIPLSFGRVRGHGIRWPLQFIYTSNIPVILVAALQANIQLWARLLEKWGHPLLGTFAGNSPSTGIVAWLYAPDILRKVITGSMTGTDIAAAITHILFMTIGSVVFAWFWVQTAGMDAKSQAAQIMKAGLQVPGFRKDERIMEHVLERYITPLTVMGAITVGLIASFADLAGALSRGTGILLTVMIIYKIYEEIAKQHMMDMNPMLKNMMQ